MIMDMMTGAMYIMKGRKCHDHRKKDYDSLQVSPRTLLAILITVVN